MTCLNKFNKLTDTEKKNHIAGSFSMWNAALGISLVGSTLMKFTEMVYNMTHPRNEQYQYQFNQHGLNSGNFGTNSHYIKLSKYPSKTTATLIL